MEEDSTHKVEIVPVKLEPHPDADTLSIVRVFDAYTVVVKTEEWAGKTHGAYIPPDNIFCQERIKARRFRGIVSMGMLVPAPEGSKEGDDVTTALGVTHYEPPEPHQGGGNGLKKAPAVTPPCYAPDYDLEALRKYGRLIPDGHYVLITEKIHGTNARFCYRDGKFHASTHYNWLNEPGEYAYYNDAGEEVAKKFITSTWWEVLLGAPELQELLKRYEGTVFYGEIYGPGVQGGFDYGQKEKAYALFDAFHPGWGKYVPIQTFMDMVDIDGVKTVPIIGAGPFHMDMVLAFQNGKSTIGGNHPREGVVVRPMPEVFDKWGNRVALKLHGEDYLLHKKS